MELSEDRLKKIRVYLSRYTKIGGMIDWLKGRLAEAVNPDDRKSLEERIEKQNVRYVQARSEIIDLIYSLSDPKQIEVLELHYINDMSIESIADTLNYSARHIRRIQREALQILCESDEINSEKSKI